MTLFQIIILPVLALLIVASIVAAARRHVPKRIAVFWAVFWLAAAVAIAFPDLTTMVARPLGFVRGVNLVLYCAILAMFVGFFMIYVRLRRIHEDVTRLVRHLAIESATLPPASADAREAGE